MTLDSPAQRLLVIKLSALGDFILALGSMEAIRRHHAGAHITLLTTQAFADIAQRSGYFDAVQVFARAPFYDLPAWARLFRFLNVGKFTRVYDLQLNGRTKIYYRLFLKKPEWSGVVPQGSHFYANPAWRQLHAFARHRAMLAELGIKVEMPELSWMAANVSLFALKAPYVLLIPGSAPSHPEKRWPAVRYGALGLKLMRLGYDVAVLGTAAEKEVIDRIVKSCPGIRDLSGRTSLYDIATLARGAAGAVGNDTGPTHLVALAGCPTVSLFSGTTNPKLSAPVGADVSVIQSASLDDLSVDDVLKNFHPRTKA